MFRMTYAQNQIVGDDVAGAGQYPCSYIQHDSFDWVANDLVPPFNNYRIGIGCPSPDTERQPKFAGERITSLLSTPVGDLPLFPESFYGDYQTLHDAHLQRTYAYLVRVATEADSNFWYRGAAQVSGVYFRKVNAAFTSWGDQVGIGSTAGITASVGGTRHEALDVVVDPMHRDHAVMAVFEVDIDAWTPTATSAGTCDISGNDTYWQTDNNARLRAYESWGWEYWAEIGVAWSGTVAAHPFAWWPATDYPVMLEWLPSGVLVASVSYPTAWEAGKVSTEWPFPKQQGVTWTHSGFAPSGQVQEFARVTDYETLPWPFALVTGWDPPSAVE